MDSLQSSSLEAGLALPEPPEEAGGRCAQPHATADSLQPDTGEERAFQEGTGKGKGTLV